MDIESRMWNFTGTGTKVHGFIGGKALCRSNIKAPYTNGSHMSYRRAADDFKRLVCLTCDKKFHAAIARAEASMMPSTGEGDYLPPAQDEVKPCCEHEPMYHGFTGCDQCRCEQSRQAMVTASAEASMMPSTGEGDYPPPAKEEAEEPAEARPVLTWTANNEWGVIGRAHRAKITVSGVEYRFTVDQPQTGHWVVRGWRRGVIGLFVYRTATTLTEAKQIVSMVVGDVLARGQVRLDGCIECRKVGHHMAGCPWGEGEPCKPDGPCAVSTELVCVYHH
jgi:hypothetical protein